MSTATAKRESLIIGMLAETFIHPGVGQANSAIDLPVARERVTDYPFIPGSGVKGAFKSWAEEQAGMDKKTEIPVLFGVAEGAGTLLFSDARLLLLPVRSLNAAYIWLTCPLLIERFARDANRGGASISLNLGAASPVDGSYLGKAHTPLVLEEREFICGGNVPMPVVTALSALLPTGPKERLAAQLVIVSNTNFNWFAKYALHVAAHNALSDRKTSDALWYEETLPPDTVMYCLLAERSAGSVCKLRGKIAGPNKYCQFGGNETVGQGWFQLTLPQFTVDAPTVQGVIDHA